MFFRYNSITHYYKRNFPNGIQKISIDAGFTCPNRDGTKGFGGCSYCNNNAFVPSYCSARKSITQQINEGIAFFSKKNPNAQYLAYFQAYSNTYAPLEILEKKYSEALNHPKIIGLIISTRPDCVNDEILDYLQFLSQKYYIVVEYGVESTNNKSLNYVNRQHTFEDSIKAIEQTAKRNLKIGIHLIFTLPFDSKENILKSAKLISDLPINFLKIHHLQILKNTAMAKDYQKNPQNYQLFQTAEQYLKFLAEYLEHLRPTIIIERISAQSPSDMLIAPKWEREKNYQLVHKLNQIMQQKNTWQGKKYK